MKTLILIVLSAFSIQTFAATKTVSATGYSAKYCQGDFGDLCINQIKREAEGNAAGKAAGICRNGGGKIQGAGRCATFCSPSFLMPGQNTTVSCNADCRFTCVTP